MNNTVKFTCTRLKNTGKAGVIKPDSDGYFDVIVGGLNIFNTAGEYYTLNGARELFEKSSSFMRRVERGALRGEVGHPRFEAGMTKDEYINRILEIRETNVCVHFKEIWLDFDNVKGPDNKPVVAIMAKVAPSGPMSHVLEKSINNSHENVAFSVRGITNDYYNRGTNMRELKTIITFDYVNEPGIPIAEKFKSPSLESFVDAPVTRNQLEAAVIRNTNVATESSKALANDLFKAMGWDVPRGAVPSFTKW